MEKKHFLIVGGGVAGVSLAVQLMEDQHQVTLIDKGINHSSLVAAGMINPMVFRRMTKSWRLDEMLPYAIDFYQSLEKQTASSFLHPIPIRRLFSSEQEREFWLEKELLPEYEPYLTPVEPEDDAYKLANNEFGSGRVKNAWYVSTAIFLQKSHEYIANKQRLIHENVDYDQFNPQNLTYKGKKYDGIIFAEGFEVLQNPWFSKSGVNTSKGETLTIQSTGIPEDVSLNRKCFILPLSEHRFKVGATYTWDTLDPAVTEEGLTELTTKIRVVTNADFEVVDHHGGIRPTSPDRRPIMGVHPSIPGFYLFNGLGTKGYMLAPLMSKEMKEFILHGMPLNPEVRINRFKHTKVE